MGTSIYLSPSTQEGNVGAGDYGTEEMRMNQVADVTEAVLKQHGLTVYRNRPDMTIQQIVTDSNAKKPDKHIAIHSNQANKTARGCEVFCHKKGGSGEQLAKAIYAELEPLTPTADRGVKEGANFYGPGKSMAELANTTAPAALVEIDFHDTAGGASWIIANIATIGTAIAKGILKDAGIQYKEQPPTQAGTPIMSIPTATVQQAKEWAKRNAAPQAFIDMAEIYWRIWPSKGLNPVFGYAQAQHETGWLYKYGSDAGLDASWHNPCGLKITSPKGSGAADHQRFPDWETGVTAHADHAALYAGAPGYPLKQTPDPRHFAYLKGAAPCVEQLGGKWAPSETYGLNLVKKMKAIEETAAADPDKERIAELEAQLKEATDKLGQYAAFIRKFVGMMAGIPAEIIGEERKET